MTTIETSLRVLIVDDNRDGADAMGLLVEALGNQVHVTYSGTRALEVARVFRPDLMLIDLVMPEMDGCDLVQRLRRLPDFAHTKIVAITGLKEDQYRDLATQAGCDSVLVKPVTLVEIRTVVASVVPVVSADGQSPKRAKLPVSVAAGRRLPIGEARRIRIERKSKALTQAESEAVLCDGIIRYQEEYLGWRSEQVTVHFVKDFFLVRIQGVLALAERQLARSSLPEKGRELIKQTRKQLLELARPMLESLVHEAASVKVRSMHHDISTVTGEEVVIFTLAEAPRFE